MKDISIDSTIKTTHFEEKRISKLFNISNSANRNSEYHRIINFEVFFITKFNQLVFSTKKKNSINVNVF